jgi:hypothetical protein
LVEHGAYAFDDRAGFGFGVLKSAFEVIQDGQPRGGGPGAFVGAFPLQRPGATFAVVVQIRQRPPPLVLQISHPRSRILRLTQLTQLTRLIRLARCTLIRLTCSWLAWLTRLARGPARLIRPACSTLTRLACSRLAWLSWLLGPLPNFWPAGRWVGGGLFGRVGGPVTRLAGARSCHGLARRPGVMGHAPARSLIARLLIACLLFPRSFVGRSFVAWLVGGWSLLVPPAAATWCVTHQW